MKYKTQKAVSVFLCAVLVFILIPCSQSYAKTMKRQALDAYNTFLSDKSVKWGDSDLQIPLDKCSFALAYIDNNSVPELILYNLGNTSHIQGYGLLYTYKNNNIICLESLSMNDPFCYYKKTGIYIDNYTGMGFSTDFYNKISGTKISIRLSRSKGYLVDDSVSCTYSTGSGEITKAEFKKKLRKLVGSRKKTTPEFYQNTAVNRTKYLG